MNTLARAPRLPPRVVALGRELALLLFAGSVTYLATDYVGVPWSPVPCEVSGVSALVAGGAMLPAAVRRKFPATALLTAALLFGWYPGTGATLALTSYGVRGRIRSVRWRRVTVALAALIPFTIGLICSQFQWRIAFLDFGIAALVCVAGPSAVQLLLGQRERLVAALWEQTSYLQANHRLAASAARLQERSRIAQEMHDLLGHRLSLISLYAGSLELDAAARSPHFTEPARLIRGTVRTAMDELRTTLGMLRQREASATRPTDETGTWPDVSRLVRQAQAGGVRIELVWTGDDLAGTALPIRQAVHRIIRESLTNVCRHAAGATAKVVVSNGPDLVRVDVFDDGHQDFDADAAVRGTGLGLVGVQERVRLLAGTFHAGRTPEGGFRVTASLPRRIVADTEPVQGEPEPDIDDRPPMADERWTLAGMSAVLAIGLIGAVAVLVVTFNMVPFESPESSYDSLQVGTARTEVVDYLGSDDPVARRAADGIEPARPPGAECWYSSYVEDEPGTMIERYCFRQNLLVDKARFDVPAG